MLAQPTIKTIGVNGQISLGKQYAGQQVLVEEQETGVWLIRTADVIPHNERWLHESDHQAKLGAALSWAATNKASDADSDAVLERLAGQNDSAE
ncbi:MULTISPECIES: hypothetical protein [Desulfovibrio]|uniref:Uncharacterized protein n=1 Tax=Desulfovibrio desulfuricans TaxID=876 RepID=A0AA94HWA7_DESDE|nr:MULTISPECIES: hypothetical protein [Desulfovibrio]ATD82213.1 hypothetical protein CNY67_13100 [Desulfovibrio sp. G11]SFW74328.1 hypothetical protein SAMN02910291_02866 [Desulfovibrio desulfuricans]SPD34823.1 Hypothetical protein DSVG11_0709 [Desulfovibrio sp. G11]